MGAWRNQIDEFFAIIGASLKDLVSELDPLIGRSTAIGLWKGYGSIRRPATREAFWQAFNRLLRKAMDKRKP